MIKSYLKWITRSLAFNKMYTFINVLGLTIGFASAFFILIYILNETSYDKHHKNKDDIYRILLNNKTYNWTFPRASHNLNEKIDNSIPEIEYLGGASSIYSFSVKRDNEYISERRVLAIQRDFLNIFTFDFLYGSPTNCFKDKNDVIITETISQKYFGDESPLNKELSVNIYGINHILKVTGVVKNYPKLSTVRFNFLIDQSFEIQELEKNLPDYIGTTLNGYFAHYMKLKPGTDPEIVNKKLNSVLQTHIPEEQDIELSIQNLNDFYLRSENISNNNLIRGNLNSVLLFSAIAILVLIIAILNYIILSFAKYLTRTKEFGIRKVTGSSSRNIRYQILMETFAIVLLSSILGILIVETNKINLQRFFQINLTYSLKSILIYYLGFFCISVFVTLISGYILSLKYIKTNPITALKDEYSMGRKKAGLRNILITSQLTIFTILLFSTIVVKKQISFLTNYNPGFDNKNFLTLYLYDLYDHYSPFKLEIGNHAAIKSITGGCLLPPAAGYIRDQFSNPDNPDIKVTMECSYVDYNFIKTMDIEIIQGRDFNYNLSTDSLSILLNESAVKALALENPIGKILNGKEIIGIVKNFHFHSLHNHVAPLCISIGQLEDMDEIKIKYDPNNIESLLAHIEEKWKKFAPDEVPEYYFYDELCAEMYEDENQFGDFLGFFTLGAIVIAILGLFGLSMFIMEKRTKEIGIRKVHGAKTSNILRLISRDFSILLLPAWLIAFPLAGYIMDKWLQNFAYQTNIDWWLYALCGLAGFIIIQSVITIKTIKTARINPVDTLRYE